MEQMQRRLGYPPDLQVFCYERKRMYQDSGGTLADYNVKNGSEIILDLKRCAAIAADVEERKLKKAKDLAAAMDRQKRNRSQEAAAGSEDQKLKKAKVSIEQKWNRVAAHLDDEEQGAVPAARTSRRGRGQHVRQESLLLWRREQGGSTSGRSPCCCGGRRRKAARRAGAAGKEAVDGVGGAGVWGPGRGVGVRGASGQHVGGRGRGGRGRGRGAAARGRRGRSRAGRVGEAAARGRRRSGKGAGGGGAGEGGPGAVVGEAGAGTVVGEAAAWAKGRPAWAKGAGDGGAREAAERGSGRRRRGGGRGRRRRGGGRGRRCGGGAAGRGRREFSDLNPGLCIGDNQLIRQACCHSAAIYSWDYAKKGSDEAHAAANSTLGIAGGMIMTLFLFGVACGGMITTRFLLCTAGAASSSLSGNESAWTLLNHGILSAAAAVSRLAGLLDVEPFLGQRLLREDVTQPVAPPLFLLHLLRHLVGERQRLEPPPRPAVRHTEEVEDRDQLAHLLVTVVVFIVALEQRPTGDELGHDASERPRVDALVVVRLPQQHLRRHVRQRAGLRVRRRQLREDGQPEVADPHAPLVAGDEDVAGLDVAVDDVALVHAVRARQELPHEGPHRALRQLLGVEVRVEAAAGDELHEQAELGVGKVAGEAVVADDEGEALARVQELRLALHLRLRLLLAHAPAVVGIADALDGHGLAGNAVARLDDDAEAAGAEEPRLLVVMGEGDADALAGPLDAGSGWLAAGSHRLRRRVVSEREGGGD
ncbi:hypothetical protein EJB05_23564, partial [Eragrostis curvula]